MSDMKPQSFKITLKDDKDYGMLFDINSIDDIQEHFNVPIDELPSLFAGDKMTVFKNLRSILTILINEDRDDQSDKTGEKLPHFDERFIGRQMPAEQLENIMTSIYKAFSGAMPEKEDKDTENPPIPGEDQSNLP